MKTFLQKLRLYDEFEIDIDISKTTFITTFQNHIDKKPSWFFNSSKNNFIGKINNNGFKIKLKREFIDLTMNTAVANGSFIEKDNKLIITTIIDGFPFMFYPYYLFCLLLYSIITFQLIRTGNIYSDFHFLPFLFHAIGLLGLPYMMLLSGTKSLTKHLEKKLEYMRNQSLKSI